MTGARKQHETMLVSTRGSGLSTPAASLWSTECERTISNRERSSNVTRSHQRNFNQHVSMKTKGGNNGVLLKNQEQWSSPCYNTERKELPRWLIFPLSSKYAKASAESHKLHISSLSPGRKVRSQSTAGAKFISDVSGRKGIFLFYKIWTGPSGFSGICNFEKVCWTQTLEVTQMYLEIQHVISHKQCIHYVAQ